MNFKKSFRQFTFNLFTKRVSVKISKLPDNGRVEYLSNKLLNELISQGHDITGSTGNCEYLSIFSYNGSISFNTSNHDSINLRLKRIK